MNKTEELEVFILADKVHIVATILNGLDDEAHTGFILCNYMRGILKLKEQAEALKNGQ